MYWIQGVSAMEKLRLLGALCACAIVLVSAVTSSNDPHTSFLLNTVFIVTCGAIGLWLLRITNISVARRIIRQHGHRRSGLPVEFPLTDSRKVAILQDRRQMPDRRLAQLQVSHSFDGQIGIIRKSANH